MFSLLVNDVKVASQPNSRKKEDRDPSHLPLLARNAKLAERSRYVASLPTFTVKVASPDNRCASVASQSGLMLPYTKLKESLSPRSLVQEGRAVA